MEAYPHITLPSLGAPYAAGRLCPCSVFRHADLTALALGPAFSVDG